MEPGEFRPMLLIAVPQMGDPNFAKSVVLILQHDRKGAFGLVVNNPTNMTLGQFAESQEMECHDQIREMTVFRGGPVEPEGGWILHTDETVEERKEILPGLYMSGSSETLKALLESGRKPMRLILGYAGWGAGQLEQEMVEGAWITAAADPKYVFETEPSRTWNVILTDMGVDPNRLMVGRGLH